MTSPTGTWLIRQSTCVCSGDFWVCHDCVAFLLYFQYHSTCTASPMWLPWSLSTTLLGHGAKYLYKRANRKWRAKRCTCMRSTFQTFSLIFPRSRYLTGFFILFYGYWEYLVKINIKLKCRGPGHLLNEMEAQPDREKIRLINGQKWVKTDCKYLKQADNAYVASVLLFT